MTVRENLSNNTRGKKSVDMEKVYWQLDHGMHLDEVAAEWGVCIRTLYRRHNEYQEEVKALLKEGNLDMPPLLPEDLPEVKA